VLIPRLVAVRRFIPVYQGVEKLVSGRQPRRTAFWKARPIRR